MDTAQATRPLVTVEITLNKADQLPEPEQLALLQSFRTNLEIILGGPERMLRTLMDQYADQCDAGADGEVQPQGLLRRAFAAAEYATWMGVERPLGAHFGLLFESKTAN